MDKSEGLSDVELRILRLIPHNNSVEALAKEVKVSPVLLGKEIAKLQLGGYIEDDGTLTEKGMNAIRGA